MLEKLKAALGRTPWDRNLRLVYSDCLEENGQFDAAQEQRRVALTKQQRPVKAKASRGRDTYDTTDTSAIYRKIHKRRFASCDRCPWHAGENADRRPGHSSWKKSRKHHWHMA